MVLLQHIVQQLTAIRINIEQGRDQAKEHLINYFIAHSYGQHHYSGEDTRYKKDYRITDKVLLALTGKIRRIHKTVSEAGSAFVKEPLLSVPLPGILPELKTSHLKTK